MEDGEPPWNDDSEFDHTLEVEMRISDFVERTAQPISEMIIQIRNVVIYDPATLLPRFPYAELIREPTVSVVSVPDRSAVEINCSWEMRRNISEAFTRFGVSYSVSHAFIIGYEEQDRSIIHTIRQAFENLFGRYMRGEDIDPDSTRTVLEVTRPGDIISFQTEHIQARSVPLNIRWSTEELTANDIGSSPDIQDTMDRAMANELRTVFDREIVRRLREEQGMSEQQQEWKQPESVCIDLHSGFTEE